MQNRAIPIPSKASFIDTPSPLPTCYCNRLLTFAFCLPSPYTATDASMNPKRWVRREHPYHHIMPRFTHCECQYCFKDHGNTLCFMTMKGMVAVRIAREFHSLYKCRYEGKGEECHAILKSHHQMLRQTIGQASFHRRDAQICALTAMAKDVTCPLFLPQPFSTRSTFLHGLTKLQITLICIPMRSVGRRQLAIRTYLVAKRLQAFRPPTWDIHTGSPMSEVCHPKSDVQSPKSEIQSPKS